MPTDLPTEQDLIQLIVSSWVALHAGTLDNTRRDLLDQQRPNWEQEAQQLLAESLLAYVTVEMVQPDLEHDQKVDPMAVASPQEFTQRLQGHVLDFLEYHQDLPKIRQEKSH